MSKEIIAELTFLLHSFCLGLGIILVYHCLRILRAVIPHKRIIIGLEDLCFWIANSFLIFGLMFIENNGTIRMFAIFGVLAGMLVSEKIGEIILKWLKLFRKWITMTVSKHK